MYVANELTSDISKCECTFTYIFEDHIIGNSVIICKDLDKNYVHETDIITIVVYVKQCLTHFM